MTQPPIYLLDDDAETLNLLKDILETANIEAQCFQNAKSFFTHINMFQKNSVLVLDLNMPEMDGVEVMRNLASMSSTPNLILISGHDPGVLHSAEKLCKEYNLEVIATLTKPISLRIFKDIIEEFILNDVVYSPKLPNRSKDEFSPEEIYDAIINNELVLYYQPKINIKNNKVMGSEALVRWQHPNKGLIFPDQFIPVIEKHGWIELLTNWVINEAVSQQHRWQKQGLHLPVSVNISAVDVISLTLPEQLESMMADKTLNHAMLKLEITESSLMGELVTSLDVLTRLRLKGIELSIDDFGTGYSSLSQLHRIPFSELKIDCSFVIGMLLDNDARAIVKTCIVLGHELGMTVVAEGVESHLHFDILREMGCDIAQGYLFSKAIPDKVFFDFVDLYNR